MQAACSMNGFSGFDPSFCSESAIATQRRNDLFSRLPNLTEIMKNAFNHDSRAETNDSSQRNYCFKTLQQLEQSLNDMINRIVMTMAKNIGNSHR